MSHPSALTPHRADPVLTALQIPDAVPIPWDDDSTSLYGVGKAAINSGLAVLIENYGGMAVGDHLSVHWDDSGVPFASHLVEAADIGHHLVLKLDEALFVEGDFQPYYRLERPSLLDVNSPARAIRVQLSTPGGEDPLPGTEHNENLAAPQVPEDLLLNGIDAEQAAQGVDITLAAYPNMAEYDRIDFNWGGQRLVHTVQLDEVGQPVVLHVEEATILAAGDGVIALAYQVIDAAANRSDGWSVTANVEVLASGTVLDAPLVPQAPNSELDLAGLAGADVRVQVVADLAQFAVGESVTLTWAGRTDAGLSVDWSDSLPVASLPQVLEFFVPNDVVTAIAQGSAVVSYTLHKLDNSDLPSKRVQIHVVGEIQTLPAPSVREASNGTLAANVEQATVDIAAYTGMAAGDLITLIWSGEKANGQPTDYRTERTVTGGMVGQTVTLTVPGAAQVAPLDGGQVTLWYQVSAAGVLQRALVHESEHLQLSVGSAAATLPAPTVLEAENGALSPDVLQATVEIAAYTGMAEGDRVDLFWRGNVTGEFTDWLPVSSTTVGHALTLTISSENIAINSSAEVSYSVTYGTGGTESSAVLQLRIGEIVPLPAPTIDQAVDDTLNPADVPNGATVRVTATANLQAGDLVTLHWETQSSTGNDDYEHSVSAGEAGKDVTFTVPFPVVMAEVGQDIQLSYEVARAAGGNETSPATTYRIRQDLPGPTIDQATGNQLDPNDVQNGATVRIDASASLLAGDLVTVHWRGTPGTGSDDIAHSVSGSEAGEDITVTVPYSVVLANQGNSVQLSYDIARAVGGSQASPVAVYEVIKQLDSGSLKVMGARSSLDAQSCYGDLGRRLVALNRNTLEPLLARWQYEGDTVSFTGNSFQDSAPSRLLHVRSADDEVILNVANISGPRWAVVARRNEGDMVAWGNSANGGNIPSSIASLTDIVELTSTGEAVAARRANGKVVAWGRSTDGGSVSSEAAALSDVVKVVGNRPITFETDTILPSPRAFVALRAAGKVVAWGSAVPGGQIPSEIAALSDITDVVGAGHAFAALRANGKVVAWGKAEAGGQVPSQIAALTNVVALVGNNDAFAARLANGSVVAWGLASSGGSVPAEITKLSDVLELIPSGLAFAARRANGLVVAWGDVKGGGRVPTDIAAMSDIQTVVGNTASFAALRSNGAVIGWGNTGTGGDVPAAIETLRDIVALTGSYGAFAALRRNGNVVAWGDSKIGGLIPSALQPELVNLHAVYAGGDAFAALRDDKHVITWGSSDGGGDNSIIAAQLNGHISYEAT
ncbi:hypothetical protein [Pseudomonas knackmussii]|uniref:hypothetical protein n=1 Tax=Pseudomonas knackmussii TaxID=65741 RepID=UPI001363B7CB|nr:hypothetical protein [Pseudomonas knackmussii]